MLYFEHFNDSILIYFCVVTNLVIFSVMAMSSMTAFTVVIGWFKKNPVFDVLSTLGDTVVYIDGEKRLREWFFFPRCGGR